MKHIKLFEDYSDFKPLIYKREFTRELKSIYDESTPDKQKQVDGLSDEFYKLDKEEQNYFTSKISKFKTIETLIDALKNFIRDVKISKSGNNSVFSEPMSFGPEEHLEFCQEVEKWNDQNMGTVRWSLWSRPSELKKSETYWNQYIKGDRQMTIFEMDDKLISVIHSGNRIDYAFDNDDRPVDKLKVKQALGM